MKAGGKQWMKSLGAPPRNIRLAVSDRPHRRQNIHQATAQAVEWQIRGPFSP